MTEVELSQYPLLWVQTGQELCSRINFLFARKYLSRFVMRITGGCSLMQDEDRIRLMELKKAMQGFTGVGLFGGTNIRYRERPEEVCDSVTEVFPSVTSRMLKLGVIAKVHDMRVTPYGIVVRDEPGSKTFSVMHSGADALLTVQPSADRLSQWEAEYKECVRLVDDLQAVGWSSVLLVFNGGRTVETELLTWAALARENPGKWRVLLVEGSGRVADKFASDTEFLRLNPSVHVCGCSSEEIRSSLVRFDVPFSS